jgi:hypothetical protein
MNLRRCLVAKILVVVSLLLSTTFAATERDYRNPKFDECWDEADRYAMGEKIISKFLKSSPYLRANASGGSYPGGIHYVHLTTSLTSDPSMEEARILIVTEAEKFISLLNSDKEIRPYLCNYPATTKNISFSINFLRKNTSPTDVTRAYVGVGKITYFRKDFSTGFNEDLCEESWKEAAQIVRESGFNISCME